MHIIQQLLAQEKPVQRTSRLEGKALASEVGVSSTDININKVVRDRGGIFFF